MAIRNLGSIFEYDDTSPSTTSSGSKSRAAHCWKYCAYSTQGTDYNGDSRIPEGEKTYHPETEGQMHTYALGSKGIGWICADNACSYFLGTATTEVGQAARNFIYLPSGTCPAGEDDFATLSGTVDHSTKGRSIVSGTRYYEI
jgi:hypothetical protein